MLAVKEVYKSFGRHQALRGINLQLPVNRTTALIGPSGSGKSTLLRIVMGLIDPDPGGHVDWEGTPIHSGVALELRRRMGYVRQDGGLFLHLTAQENIELVPKYLRWTEDRRRTRLAELCELARLEPTLLKKFPSQLSGGQRQRVSLMRALVLDPGLLLLDEPLGALDPLIRGELQEELRELFKRLGKTVVLVTHDLAEAGFLGDHLVLLDEGKIVQAGPLSDLIQNPANDFVRRFVGAQRSLAEVLFS
jgi:osmoprotectant transport system ATP-binding protein